MFDTVQSFILLVIGFGLVIFIHELGHFLVAKFVGIRVDQFAIGFGKAALAWRKGIGLRVGTTTPAYEQKVKSWLEEHRRDELQRQETTEPFAPEGAERAAAALSLGETEYRLNWLPLGGYVKMLGQDDLDPTATSNNPRSYTAKPVWARMAVISAGVILNLVSAVVLFIACFMWGVEFPPPVIGEVVPGAPAALAQPDAAAKVEGVGPGLKSGDLILEVNGSSMRKFDDVQAAVALAHQETPVRFKVERDGRVMSFDVQAAMSAQGLLSVGILPERSLEIGEYASASELELVLALSGLDHADLNSAMKLASIDGEPVSSFQEYEAHLAAHVGTDSVSLEFAPFGENAASATPTTIEYRPIPDYMLHPETGDYHILGLSPAIRVVLLTSETSSPAAEAGVEPGDLIARVGAVAWPSTSTLREVVEAGADRNIDLTVYRDGEFMDLTVRPNRQGTIGIYMQPAHDEAILSGILPELPVDEPNESGDQAAGRPSPDDENAVTTSPLNFPPGTRIIALNDREIQGWRDVVHVIRTETERGSGPVTLELTGELPLPNRPVETVEWTLLPQDVERIHDLAWRVPRDVFAYRFEPLQADHPIEAIALGFDETWRILTMTYLTIDRLIRGSVDARNIKGPVGIAHIGTQVASRGLSYLIMFLAVISVNLAVLNFLPIPILDGGQFVFLVIEKLKGSPVPAQIQDLATLAGLVIIGAIFVFVTFNDLRNLFG